MATWYDLTETYWTQPQDTRWRAAVDYPPVMFATFAEAMAAGHTERAKAEWSMPHVVALYAGEISRLEMQLRRPAVFFVASIWEIMEYGYSGGEFPGPLVEAYIERNGDIWPMLEEAGFTKGADNHRAWSTYDKKLG